MTTFDPKPFAKQKKGFKKEIALANVLRACIQLGNPTSGGSPSKSVSSQIENTQTLSFVPFLFYKHK